MKIGQLLLFVCVFTYHGKAQTNVAKEPGPTKEQKWLLDKTSAFYKQKGNDASSIDFLVQFKKLLATNRLCNTNTSPAPTLALEGDRLNTQNALLTFNVTNESGGAVYIVERRFNDPLGKFDSVGVITGTSAETIASSYHFIDNNDHVGKTWYRIRKLGSSDDKQLVCIEGYNNKVNVYPNPVTSTAFHVQVKQFKTDDNTNVVVMDNSGRIVYTQSKVYLHESNTLTLRNLKLPAGTYHVRLANQFNTGGATFIVH